MKSVKRQAGFGPLVLAVLVALAGCQSVPQAEPEATSARQSGGEEAGSSTELNLPEQVADATCDCDDVAVEVDESNFDRGIRALAARDYVQALRYFESHAMAETENAAREAEVGLAFVAVLRASGNDGMNSQALDDRAEVMALALALLTRLEDRVDELVEANSLLATDLEKREAVLERLRELTLGQLEE